MKYAIIKADNGMYRLVRDEGSFEPLWIPYSGMASKYKLVERKTIKGVQNWTKKHGISECEYLA